MPEWPPLVAATSTSAKSSVWVSHASDHRRVDYSSTQAKRVRFASQGDYIKSFHDCSDLIK
jgi:hypothetical protein